MKTRVKHLKVKIKSLAAESKIIRYEERKAKDQYLRQSLYLHRVKAVRDEARWSQLAYGFLRGRPYNKLEPNSKKAVNWDRIAKLVSSFGECWHWDCDRHYKEVEKAKIDQEFRLKAWIREAKLYNESRKLVT